MAKRRISILGATGSVGQSTLDLIRRAPEAYDVVALTAHSNVDALAALAREFRPDVVAIGNSACHDAVSRAVDGLGVEVMSGTEGVDEAACRPADWIMAAIVGAAGLRPTLRAIQQGTTVAFANKECLVCAGGLMMDEVRRCGTTLLPVDSEHNAMFQVFEAAQRQAITRLILTGSGGPFRTASVEDMRRATPAEAIRHPNWSMGAKISVDSATMMNKGLEFIEAHYLFDMPTDRIDILVHPQSVIHSMVEYSDGSVLAQLGSPDMRTPIAYTLAWPARMDAPVERLDFTALKRLDFEEPDPSKFRALTLARDALDAGMAASITLNAANEVGVAAFLEHRISLMDIPRLVEDCLATTSGEIVSSIDDVIALDATARRMAQDRLQGMAAA